MDGIALVVLAAGRGERFGGVKQLAPAGPNGETLMDYSIYNALAVGFGRAVVVVRSQIEEAVTAHLHNCWADQLPVAYVNQPTSPLTEKPDGTAHAVLAARGVLGDQPFAVINADDLYGQPALGALHGWLSRRGSLHALVAFPLARTLLPDSAPVVRALCQRKPDGTLAGLVEATVECREGSFVARPLNRAEATEVEGHQLVSMNAFVFRPSIWPILDEAVNAGPAGSGGEALLPAVIDSALARVDVVVLPIADRCVGITWPRDLDALKQDVRQRIDAGELPARVGSRA